MKVNTIPKTEKSAMEQISQPSRFGALCITPRGQTVNHKFYQAIIRHLTRGRVKETIRTPAETQLVSSPQQQTANFTSSVQKSLANTKTAVVQLPPQSPHVSQADFFLFPKFKVCLK
jgi:hypothetical protein